MTRDEAKNFGWFQSDRKKIYEHIDKIYDGFKIASEYNSKVYSAQQKETNAMIKEILELKSIIKALEDELQNSRHHYI